MTTRANPLPYDPITDVGNPRVPFDEECRFCGGLAWRKELGRSDRHWDGGFVCAECAVRNKKSWIGLISPQGHTEYNARFVLGDAAERLEHGKWYTNQELINLAGPCLFLKDSLQAKEKNITKWRCDIQQ